LSDVLKLVAKDVSGDVEHVVFTALDGMSASIPIYKALSEYGDVILATHMNDEIIPPEHGYPLRAIVPGHVGVRNVKWVNSVKLSKEEAVGDWQRGLNYKVLPPGAENASGIDISKLPAMQESSVFSAISNLENNDGFIDCKGWAFAGGGRGIARVDISTDGGSTWHVAEITEGKDQKKGREWAWVFWEANDIPASTCPDSNGKEVEVISRAVDTAYNSQPEECAKIWNMRGLGNNSWYRRRAPANP
jgi:sulfite oxidase